MAASGRRGLKRMTDVRCYQLLDLHIDLVRQEVSRDGMPLDVQGLSFQLLAFLIGNGTEVASFDRLIEGVWAPAVVNEETVTQRVKLLRQALGDDGRRPRYIRSIRGRGYQLCGPPQALDEAVAQAPRVPSRRLRLVGATTMIAIIVLGVS